MSVIAIRCTAGAAWPEPFHGSIDARAGSLSGSDGMRLGTFRSADPFEEVSGILLVLRYEQRRTAHGVW